MDTVLNLTDLFAKNEIFADKFKHSALMSLLENHKIQDKAVRDRLLDGIQVFSDYFQKVVMLRNVFCDDIKFQKISTQHLIEEFGHNLSLLKDRNNRLPVWDPILDACASWFAWKMFTLDNDEKTFLVHFVLESSANIFFRAANQVITQYGETNYFKLHSDVDEEHEAMGKEVLNDVSSEKLQRLILVQQQSWDVLNATCERIAEIALKPLN